MKEGMKFDNAKLRYDLIPIYPLEQFAAVLTYGANKYADRNWEKGIKYSRCYAALMRHVTAFWKGEDIDVESGLPHLAHVLCNASFLLEFTQKRKKFDDRPKKGKK